MGWDPNFIDKVVLRIGKDKEMTFNRGEFEIKQIDEKFSTYSYWHTAFPLTCEIKVDLRLGPFDLVFRAHKRRCNEDESMTFYGTGYGVSAELDIFWDPHAEEIARLDREVRECKDKIAKNEREIEALKKRKKS